jgi:lipopolysaccharide biosynthesis regulator YciM
VGNSDRTSAEILVDALRETSASMREGAVETRDIGNKVDQNTKAIDELRREQRQQAALLGRLEAHLDRQTKEQESRKDSTKVLAKLVQEILKSPAVQFIFTAFGFWAAAKLGVLQYLGVTSGN